MKKALVTGASGFLGRRTVEALQQAGWNVAVTTRHPGSVTSNNLYLDLQKPDSIFALEKLVRCDAIVHLGGLVGFANHTIEAFYTANILATGCLANLSRKWGSLMVFASSISVHGSRVENVTDLTPVMPDSPYGRSKALAEDLINASGTRSCNLRIPGIFGEDGPPHLGLNRAIRFAMLGETPVCFGNGSALRNYISVGDMATTILHVLDRKLEGIHPVAGPERMTIREMLEAVCRVWLPDQQLIQKPGVDGHDQIVIPSKELPKGKSFFENLESIKDCYLKKA